MSCSWTWTPACSATLHTFCIRSSSSSSSAALRVDQWCASCRAEKTDQAHRVLNCIFRRWGFNSWSASLSCTHLSLPGQWQEWQLWQLPPLLGQLLAPALLSPPQRHHELGQSHPIILSVLTDFRVIIDPEWSLAPIGPFSGSQLTRMFFRVYPG